MRPTPARHLAAAAAASLALLTAACSSSGSTHAAQPVATTSSVVAAAATPSTTAPAPTSTPTSTPAAPTTGLPAAAHRVSAVAYQVGTDDYHGTAHAMPGVVQFTSPSGNIACTYLAGAQPSLACSITAHDFALPARPAGCTLNWAGGLITLDRHSAVLGHCVGGAVVTYHSRTLPYGDVLTSGGISCYSGPDAVTCTDHGHGFELSRAAARTF